MRDVDQSDRELLAQIRADTRVVFRDAIGDAEEVVLLDTPRHQNSGDSIIWMGERRYLADLDLRIAYHSDLGRFKSSDMKRVSKSAVILLHGGGNLGDIYKPYDEFRRHIVRTYSDRRIVILPQSMHYQSPLVRGEAYSDYLRAKDLKVLLREPQSIDSARRYFPDLDTRFCFDAAFGAPIEELRSREGHQLLVLSRTDAEARTDSNAYFGNQTDWEFSRLGNLAWRSNILVGALYKRSPWRLQKLLFGASQRANTRCMEMNVAAAIEQFSNSGVVATNRLHAHVLCILLGIPHVVTDNSYGKIAAVYNAYSGSFSAAHWADSLSGATIKAEEILSSVSHANR